MRRWPSEDEPVGERRAVKVTSVPHQRKGTGRPLLALALAVLMTGCAGQAQPKGADVDGEALETTQKADPTPTAVEEDGQNPVMNYVGVYGCGRATITVMAKGAQDAEITIQWGSSASSGSEWTMSGTFDDATKTVRYTNGTGMFSFDAPDSNSLVWRDDVDNAADGMVFAYSL